MVRLGYGVAKCTVCGALAGLSVRHANLRETCLCRRCGASNRQRQIAYVCASILAHHRGRKIRSFSDVRALDDLVVYNTEARGPVHRQLSGMRHYHCSEYFGPNRKSGEVVDNVLHQDLMNLSFPRETFDLVLSSDVFEHVPDPYRAHREVHRVLKPGGRHIFTIPFYQAGFMDETRATVDERGTVTHVTEPLFHEDPMRLEAGILVYTIFSLEMLCRLHTIGFRTNMYHLYRPSLGIVGFNAIVFEAIKD